MAINRGPWNALVDDDGSNLVGSVWNKAAIKTVLLDPIDAYVGLPAVRLAAARSFTTNAAGENLASIVFASGQLGIHDLVMLDLQFAVNGTVPGPIVVDLYGVQTGPETGGVLLICTGTQGAGDLGTNQVGQCTVVLRAPASGDPYVLSMGSGVVTIGTGQAIGRTFGALGGPVGPWAGAWKIFLRQLTGLAPGARLYWSWAVRHIPLT
jgi:hypothetical protein